MNKNEKNRQLYLAALQERAFHHATTIEQLIERLENGELPSDVARVAIDGRKWIASHFQPVMFSERVQQHLTVMLNGKIVWSTRQVCIYPFHQFRTLHSQ